MLADLTRRMHNDPDVELVVASEEQRKITRLRLVKWLLEQPGVGQARDSALLSGVAPAPRKQ